jgi:hypothetical protein
MNLKYLKTKHKFLMWCMEDYTSLFSLLSFVEEFYGYEDLELLKTTTLNIIKDLLEEESIQTGFLKNENAIEIWKKDINSIIKEIKYQWDNLNRPLNFHEIVWFTATIKGIIEFTKLNAFPEIKEVDAFYLDNKN